MMMVASTTTSRRSESKGIYFSVCRKAGPLGTSHGRQKFTEHLLCASRAEETKAAATLSWKGFVSQGKGRQVPKNTNVKNAHGFREDLRFQSLSPNR